MARGKKWGRHTVMGVSGTTRQLCLRFGVNHKTVEYRMKAKGMSLEQALTTSLGPARYDPEREYTVLGHTGMLKTLVRKIGVVSYGAALYRIRNGWSAEDAITTPPSRGRVYHTKDGDSGTVAYFAKKYGMRVNVMSYRLNKYNSPTLNEKDKSDVQKLAEAIGVGYDRAYSALRAPVIPVKKLAAVIGRLRPHETPRVVTYFGRTMLLREALECAGIPRSTFYGWRYRNFRGKRLSHDLTDDADVTEFLQTHVYDSNKRSGKGYAELSRRIGAKPGLVGSRLRAGWSLDDAASIPTLQRDETLFMHDLLIRRRSMASAGIII